MARGDMPESSTATPGVLPRVRTRYSPGMTPGSVLLFAAAAKRLSWGASVLERLVQGVPDGQARWKPEPSQWSILEVVCHLGDEEVDDFRKRIELTLLDPERTWPPIDPP